MWGSPVGGFNQTVGNRVLGLRVRDGHCIFCTQLMAETTGVFELSHRGEHRRGGCKGEKRLTKRAGRSLFDVGSQGELVSRGEGGGVNRKEGKRSVQRGETADQSFSRWGLCVAPAGFYVLRTLWAVKCLRFDD